MGQILSVGLSAGVCLLALAGSLMAARYGLRRRMGGRAERLALLFRLENVADLRQNLGTIGMVELLSEFDRLCSREFRTAPGQHRDGGSLICLMPIGLSSARALRCAKRLQDICQAGLYLVSGRARPVLSGMIVSDPSGAMGEGALWDHGHDQLVRLGSEGRGRIHHISFARGPGGPEGGDGEGERAAEAAELLFQPQRCGDTGAIIGAEIRARLRHPTRGLVTGRALAPWLAPEQRRDVLMGLFPAALRALRDWDRSGAGIDCLSLGVDRQLLRLPDLADLILWELDRQDIAPARLVITIRSEDGAKAPVDLPLAEGEQLPLSFAAAQSERFDQGAAVTISRLATAGCQIELADFGLGGPALDGLRRFGATRLRIGADFVADCDRAPEQQRMILTILALAERLGMAPHAEGVETSGEYAYLAQIGLGQLQGKAISPPLTQSEISAHLAAQAGAGLLVSPLRQFG